MQIRTIQMHATGGPDVLVPTMSELAAPAVTEVRVRQHAVGVNYVDVYQRNGRYRVPGLPAILGVEGAGVVEAVGAQVSEFQVGDRVAYFAPPVGGYAEARNLPAARLLALPDAVPFEVAATAMLRGVTAHMLFHHVRPLRPGDTVLVHAAAGGLGLILVQWARSLGARVLGTVSSAAKAELALAAGLDHAILYRQKDFVAEVKRLTDGAGAELVIDGVGGDTLPRSLEATAPFGTVASIGATAGESRAIRPDELGPVRSIALASPSAFRFAADLPRYRVAALDTVDRLAAGLRVHVGAQWPLPQAAAAHRELERGTYAGGLVLLP